MKEFIVREDVLKATLEYMAKQPAVEIFNALRQSKPVEQEEPKEEHSGDAVT